MYHYRDTFIYWLIPTPGQLYIYFLYDEIYWGFVHFGVLLSSFVTFIGFHMICELHAYFADIFADNCVSCLLSVSVYSRVGTYVYHYRIISHYHMIYSVVDDRTSICSAGLSLLFAQ